MNEVIVATFQQALGLLQELHHRDVHGVRVIIAEAGVTATRDQGVQAWAHLPGQVRGDQQQDGQEGRPDQQEQQGQGGGRKQQQPEQEFRWDRQLVVDSGESQFVQRRQPAVQLDVLLRQAEPAAGGPADHPGQARATSEGRQRPGEAGRLCGEDRADGRERQGLPEVHPGGGAARAQEAPRQAQRRASEETPASRRGRSASAESTTAEQGSRRSSPPSEGASGQAHSVRYYIGSGAGDSASSDFVVEQCGMRSHHQAQSPGRTAAEIAADELYDMDWTMEGDFKLPPIPPFPFAGDSQSIGMSFHDFLGGKVKEPEEEIGPPPSGGGGRAAGDQRVPREPEEAAVVAASDASAEPARDPVLQEFGSEAVTDNVDGDHGEDTGSDESAIFPIGIHNTAQQLAVNALDAKGISMTGSHAIVEIPELMTEYQKTKGEANTKKGKSNTHNTKNRKVTIQQQASVAQLPRPPEHGGQPSTRAGSAASSCASSSTEAVTCAGAPHLQPSSTSTGPGPSGSDERTDHCQPTAEEEEEVRQYLSAAGIKPGHPLYEQLAQATLWGIRDGAS